MSWGYVRVRFGVRVIVLGTVRVIVRARIRLNVVSVSFIFSTRVLVLEFVAELE